MESDSSKFCPNVMEEINSARTNPQKYAEKLKGMIKSFDGKVLRLPGTKVGLTTMEGASAFEEAISFLMKLIPLPALTIDSGLNDTATVMTEKFKQCKDMNEMQKLDRNALIAQQGSFEGESGVSTDFGTSTPEMLCINFIVDDGDKGRHNREMMFKREFKLIGCATCKHDQFRSCTVVMYAKKFTKGKVGSNVISNKKPIGPFSESQPEEDLSDNIREIHNSQPGGSYW